MPSKHYGRRTALLERWSSIGAVLVLVWTAIIAYVLLRPDLPQMHMHVEQCFNDRPPRF